MASRPDKKGNYVVQSETEINDVDMEEVINIDNIESNKKTKKDCMILNLLEEKDGKYLVLWSNYTKSWVDSKDISEYAYTNIKEINTHNDKVKRNVGGDVSKINSKKGVIYGRVSNPQQKTTHIQSYSNSTNTSHSTSTTSKSYTYSHPMNSMNFSDSIETQKQLCYEHCLKNNIMVEYAAYDDGISGRNMKNMKHELGAFTPHLRSGEHTLIVLTPDRLGRHVARVQCFLQSMIDRNIDVYFVKEDILWNKQITSDKKRIIQQILIDAEYFSDQTSERVKNTYRRKKAQGHKMGKAPFGFKAYRNKDGIRKFKVCPKEDLITKDILKMHKIQSINTKKYTKKYQYELIQQHIMKVYKRTISLNMIKNIIKKHNNIDLQAKINLNHNIDYINNGMFSLIINSENTYKGKGKGPAKTQSFEMIDNEEIDVDNIIVNKPVTKPKLKSHHSSDGGFFKTLMSYFSNEK